MKNVNDIVVRSADWSWVMVVVFCVLFINHSSRDIDLHDVIIDKFDTSSSVGD